MFYLKRNLPTIERIVRLGLGACTAFVIYKLALADWLQLVGYASAVTLAGTALVGFCPACALLGRKPVSPRP